MAAAADKNTIHGLCSKERLHTEYSADRRELMAPVEMVIVSFVKITSLKKLRCKKDKKNKYSQRGELQLCTVHILLED